MLAWGCRPGAVPKEWCAADLESQDDLVQLFDACQILEASVGREGWRFLFEVHGLGALLAANRVSDWFEADDAAWGLVYHSRVAGYDPNSGAYGLYDERSGVFTPQR